MNDLIINETRSTPKIVLNSKGTIDIVGKSYPENTFVFYAPVVEWIKEYFDADTPEIITVNLELIYFNSGSSKQFYEFFDLFSQYNDKYTININWIYDEDNDVIEEIGEDLQDDFEDLNIVLSKK